MSAALITANLQATLRAFAPNKTSPARLCHRLNQALCASPPMGRFVTRTLPPCPPPPRAP